MSGTANCGGRNKTRIRTYACPNHSVRREKICTNKPINAEYLEKAVKGVITDRIRAYVDDKNNCASVLKQAKSTFAEEIKTTNKRIASLDAEISRLMNKAASASSPLLSERYETEAKKALQATQYHKDKLAELNKKLSIIDDIGKTMKEVSKEIIFASDAITRELVSLYIDRIEIDEKNDKIIINTNEL
jgi:septal ring factor EnvC (AmiA/AmiB activator)